MGSNLHSYSVPVTAVTWTISSYIGPRYNGTWLYVQSLYNVAYEVYHLPKISSFFIPTAKHFKSRQWGQNLRVLTSILQLPLKTHFVFCKQKQNHFNRYHTFGITCINNIQINSEFVAKIFLTNNEGSQIKSSLCLQMLYHLRVLGHQQVLC